MKMADREKAKLGSANRGLVTSADDALAMSITATSDRIADDL